MTTLTKTTNRGLHALRRQGLLELCEQQRLAFAMDTQDLLLPFSPSHLRQRLGARLKLPLMLAGGLLGVFLLRPKRLMPAITAGASVWNSTRALLPLLRGLTARVGKRPASKLEAANGDLD